LGNNRGSLDPQQDMEDKQRKVSTVYIVRPTV